MTGKDYLATQLSLIEMGKRTQTLDLDAFLVCIKKAETMAPNIDPVLFKRGAASLYAIRQLAEAFRRVKTEYHLLGEATAKSAVMVKPTGLP